MSNNEIEKFDKDDNEIAKIEGNAPLTVDLPEGQKIVIGEIDPRTTIEVSTWQGLGKPNSKTNRIKIEVAKVEALVTANTEENISTPESISIPHLKVSSNQIRTGVANENLFPVRVADNETKLTETEVNSRKKKTIFTILYIAITILIVAAVSVIGNFRLIHPMSGDKNSLGKISNSLVLVTKTSSFQPGDMVTANISSKKWSPTYGVIEAINGKNILLTNQIGSFEINKDALSGKAIVVIPFLGLLARF